MRSGFFIIIVLVAFFTFLIFLSVKTGNSFKAETNLKTDHKTNSNLKTLNNITEQLPQLPKQIGKDVQEWHISYQQFPHYETVDPVLVPFHEAITFPKWSSLSGPVLNLVVPMRNRTLQWDLLYQFMRKHLKNQRFFLTPVEDVGEQPFNKGALMNLGFLEGESRSNFTCFQDVDHFPSDKVKYVMPSKHNVFHLAALPFPSCLGGCVCFLNEDYRSLNGMSNRFGGWGFEDNFMQLRVLKAGFKVVRRHYSQFYHLVPGHTKRLTTVHPKHGFQNHHLLKIAQQNYDLFEGDGLSVIEALHPKKWFLDSSAYPSLPDQNGQIFKFFSNFSDFVPCPNDVGNTLKKCVID
eukprot:TRINITY_DN1472_c0_g1_i3.p1 TRINITY_DN1472_c0_g1~~TRINITY_DN1472_c0_g1_i3.p1  ORF type:complete len:350 (+),score=54.62 TRINITY_DN1472_c0_g1_i3:114-1163(+)